MSSLDKIKVELGQYKGIQIPKAMVSVTEEELMEELKRAQQMAASKVAKDGAAETGDETLIDFIGYMDGVAFPGGDGIDFPLVLGSGQFIPGFEEQLVGANKGDRVEVKVTFPENYHAAELAGKEAMFKVDIKEIRTLEVPELGDEMVKKISPCKTLEEFKAYVKSQILEYKEKEMKTQKETYVVNKVMETSVITIPDEEINIAAENLKQGFYAQLQQSGQNIEQYLEYCNMTMEAFEQSAIDQAQMMLRGQALLAEIAKVEGIVVTEDDLNNELVGMAANYHMSVDDLKDAIREDGIELVRGDIAASKAIDMVVAYAVEV